MLFFENAKKKLPNRPKTVAEMKRLQNFVKAQVSTPGESLTNSIQKQAHRDETFNEFIKKFKSKNEKEWANIIDLTQEDMEDKLLSKSLKDRRDDLVMLEEFRRRKNLERFRELTYEKYQ
jgi:hypothetical protein